MFDGPPLWNRLRVARKEDASDIKLGKSHSSTLFSVCPNSVETKLLYVAVVLNLLMLQPFNTVLHGVVTANHKILFIATS